MKFPLPFKLTALATIGLTSIVSSASAQSTFDETPVDQSRLIAVASPFGQNSYNLLVIEQITNQRDCWRTEGSNPVRVEPLLLEFDFTGICGRYTDANGYSARIDGQDLGLDYMLRIVRRGEELQLVATPRTDRTRTEYIVGRTNGFADGFLQFQLEPGWDFTKRTFEGRVLGHVYFSNDQITLDGRPVTETPAAFRDIRNDTYRTEISQAVELGFVAGFNDQTFRPNENLTREQIVSMVVEGLIRLPDSNIRLPERVSTRPYPDVDASRWSAAKIQWARDNNLISGYPNGTFRPTQPVTRAELIAIQRRAAEFAKRQQGRTPQIQPTQNPTNFTDLGNHWARGLVTEMSGYCSVATPLNEVGSTFFPDTPARRNYAAAATLRMLNCVQPNTATTTQPPATGSNSIIETIQQVQPIPTQTTPANGITIETIERIN